jgi:TRAP-type mannitol/chloroaromatic compound transport system permease small subunit
VPNENDKAKIRRKRCGEEWMTSLLALSRAIDRLNEFIGRWVSWLVLAAILVSAINAAVRKAFDMSSNAWLELQWYLFGAVFMLASAYTLQQNEHIRIDIIYGGRSKKTQDRIDLFGHLFFLLPFCLLMDRLLIPYVIRSFESGEMSANAGGLILWPSKAILLGGFLLLTLQSISEIIKRIAIMRGIIEDPNPYHSTHSVEEADEAAEDSING